MIYLLTIFIFGAGYYALTYGTHIWKKEKNRLGGFGVILLALTGTIIPIYVLFLKR